MRCFTWKIREDRALHARPAVRLAQIARQYESKITFSKKGQSVKATSPVALLGLGAAGGDTLLVRVMGADEEIALTSMESAMRDLL